MAIVNVSAKEISTQSGLPIVLNVFELDTAFDFTSRNFVANYNGIMPPSPIILVYDPNATPIPDMWGDVKLLHGINYPTQSDAEFNYNDETYLSYNCIVPINTQCCTILGIFKDTNDDYFFIPSGIYRGNVSNATVLPTANNYGQFYYNASYNWNLSWTVANVETWEDYRILGNALVQGSKDTDPYKNGGNSSMGGGTGNFDNTSDSIDFPSLPSLSAVDTGFITLYNPSLAQIQSLANYMWSSAFDLDTFKKLFADPMSAILGLSIVPVNVPSGSTKAVTIGNISTGVNMTVASSQYVEVDCGSINVNEYWGAYLDYEPYTKAEIYLPYCGTHPLSVDEIMGKTVAVKYHVDVLSGACTAYVKCGNSVLYEFIGQCSASIPINGNDWTNVINGVLSIAGSVGTMVATGGATAPMTIGAIASTAVNSFKPSVEKSGAVSGVGGMLAIQKPYIILSRPKQAVPTQQNVYMGYPSFITSKLVDLQGYTEIDSIRIENVPCTESEYNELLSLLKSGVIL